MTANVDVRRAPFADRSCVRWNYKSGQSVRVEGQSGDYYYVYNIELNDYGWVTRSSVSFASNYQTESQVTSNSPSESSQTNSNSNPPQIFNSSAASGNPAESSQSSSDSNPPQIFSSSGACSAFEMPRSSEVLHPERQFTRQAASTYKQRIGPRQHSTCDRGARAYKGASLSVQAIRGDWYYVYNHQNGLYGWVHNGVF